MLLPSTLSMDQRNIPVSGTSWLDYQVTSDPLPSDGIFGPPPPSLFCDDRLARLDIRRWTNVHIRNDYAAMVISLYLETDHSILGFFDADLFVDDLVNLGTRFCSPLLVNSLLFWACVSSARLLFLLIEAHTIIASLQLHRPRRKSLGPTLPCRSTALVAQVSI